MKTNELSKMYKEVAVQNGLSVMTCNLESNVCDFKVIDNSIKEISDIIMEDFPNALIKNNLIAKDCIVVIKEFCEKISNGIPNGECTILIRNSVGQAFKWFHFSFSLSGDKWDKDTVACISIRQIDEDVNNKLLNGFWSKEIVSGIGRGNSYFMINVDDEFILNARGKFAIETKNLQEQVDYIADLCCDGSSQKIRQILSKENLLKIYDENESIELLDVLIQDIDGIQRWFKIKVVFTRHYINNKIFAHITFTDIDVKHRAAEDIKYNATHDVLTGVLNRHTFTEMVSDRIDYLNKNYWNALIFIDIDDFKRFNDVFGHAVGDRVLRGVAKGIKKSFRANDIIGRVGGDEFMVLFSVPSLYALYSRVNLLNSNIKAESNIDSLSVSFGVALFCGGNKDFDRLYKLSDMAMYNAKKAGKNCYCFIDEYENCFLNKNLYNISNLKVEQLLRLQIKDYMFCCFENGKIYINYTTPRLFNKVLGEKRVTTIDDLSEIMGSEEAQKLNKMAEDSLNEHEILKTIIYLQGVPYKINILTINSATDGKAKTFIGFSKSTKSQN